MRSRLRRVVETDLSRWPLVITRLAGKLTLEDAEIVVRESTAVLKRFEAHASIFDCSGVLELPDAVVRKRFGEFTGWSAPLSKKSTVCTGLVIQRVVLRGALTAIHWIGRPVTPTRVFSTHAEAEGWCTDELAKVGRQVPKVSTSG
jgi:hypothetical protein